MATHVVGHGAALCRLNRTCPTAIAVLIRVLSTSHDRAAGGGVLRPFWSSRPNVHSEDGTAKRLRRNRTAAFDSGSLQSRHSTFGHSRRQPPGGLASISNVHKVLSATRKRTRL